MILRDPFRRTVRRAFYRSSVVRRIIGRVDGLKPGAPLPDLAHLRQFNETAVGPIQRDEALFLHGLVRVVRPRTVLEVGFLHGHSAFNFLQALDPDARLYSFDIDPACADRARTDFGFDPRLIFRTRSQTELTPDDLDGRQADFVFLDASHDLSLNKQTFDALVPMMADDAILAVHDTGTITCRLVPEGHYWLGTRAGWIGEEREVMPDERAFVNWLLSRHPEFSQVHLHSLRVLRYGITLLQRSVPLARPPGVATDEGEGQEARTVD